MTSYVVDAWAWLEYFSGSEKGQQVRKIFEDKQNRIYCLSTTLAEVVSKMARRQQDVVLAHQAMANLATFIAIDEKRGANGGQRHAELKSKAPNLSLSDALVVAVAEELKAVILTGDSDFKGLKNLYFL